MSEYENAIELHAITKRFGEVTANNNINLTLRRGEILALLGENGSGKTTLMNMLSGIYKPDSGEILVGGREAVINSPEDSKRLGIGMVHQHFKLVDSFSAADNIRIGDDSGASRRECRDKIEKICRDIGFDIDIDTPVGKLSVSEKQSIEIVKVLYYGATTVILDEPTAVLTVQETERLFDVMRRMKKEGHSIIIITHKLHEIMSVSDRVAVLRRGEYITTVDTADSDERLLTELMMGGKTELSIERPKIEKKEPLLEIRSLTVKGDDGSDAIKDISFYIRSGEILGVAGIAGCGQKELCEAIAGLRPIEHGMMIHKGAGIVGLGPGEIIKKGISMSFIPEDRLGMGLSPSLSITDNMLLKSYRSDKGPFVNRKRGRAEASEIIDELSVVTPSTETPVRLLSGGNVQKVLVGREIKSGPNVIVTAYPVRGLDVNSSYAIYRILNEEKKKGVGILFVGEDLDVLMELCDKIMVLCHGKLMGIVHAHKTTKEEIGLMMTGTLDMTMGDKPVGIAKDSRIPEGDIKASEDAQPKDNSGKEDAE